MIENKTKAPGAIAENESGGSPWLVLAVLSVGVILAALDLTVVVAILTAIMDDLNITVTEIDKGAWIVSAYLLAYTVTMPFMGRVSDVYGRRGVFLGALLVFVAGSLLGAIATTLPMMIAARAIQALGGGAMVPVSMAVVGDLFPPKKRGMALGIIGAADTAGWVIGPLYGSFMLKFISWHAVFWINVPLGLISAAIIFFALKPIKNLNKQKGTRRIDYLGFALLAASLTFLTLALGGGKETTALSGASLEDIDKNPLREFQIPLIIGAVLAMALFIFVELKVKYPLLNLRTFRHRAYSAANAVNLIIGGVLIVGLVGIALFVNTTDTSTTLVDISFHSALALAPMTLGMALGAIGGGWLSDRFGYRWVTVGGLLMAIGGFVLMYNWDIHWKPPADLLNLFPGAGLSGVGFGIVIAPVGSAVIDWAEHEDIGVAAALVLILRLVGMTIGIAAVTSWALNRYNELKPKNIKIAELTGDMLRLPLAQVVTEMFLAAAVIAAIGLIPALLLSRRKDADPSQHEISRIL